MKFTESRTFKEKAGDEWNLPEDGIKAYFDHKEKLDENEVIIRKALEIMRSRDSVDLVAHCMVNEHPTHQQLQISGLYQALKIYGENQFADARNESAVNWAKKSTSEDTYFPYI